MTFGSAPTPTLGALGAAGARLNGFDRLAFVLHRMVCVAFASGFGFGFGFGFGLL